jgi:hypothetical protein
MIPIDMERAARRLTLVSPLSYIEEEGLDPFSWGPEEGECLFCFQTGEGTEGIEVEEERFLGSLIFGARAGTASTGERIRELPRGAYLFVQLREILKREEILHLAAELHREGLWQRFSLEPRFFLRYLFEDRRGVTQLFRPLRGNINPAAEPPQP